MSLAFNDLCVRDADTTESLGMASSRCSTNNGRAVVGVPWQDHETNEWVICKTKVQRYQDKLMDLGWLYSAHGKQQMDVQSRG